MVPSTVVLPLSLLTVTALMTSQLRLPVILYRVAFPLMLPTSNLLPPGETLLHELRISANYLFKLCDMLLKSILGLVLEKHEFPSVRTIRFSAELLGIVTLLTRR